MRKRPFKKGLVVVVRPPGSAEHLFGEPSLNPKGDYNRAGWTRTLGNCILIFTDRGKPEKQNSVNVRLRNTEEMSEARAQGAGRGTSLLGQVGWGQESGGKDGCWEGRLLVSVVSLVPDFVNYLRVLL